MMFRISKVANNSNVGNNGLFISTEAASQKFLRSLPFSWSQVSLIMRTKPKVDTLNFDDLYNNLRVFESDVKGSTGSSSSTQDVAFISFDKLAVLMKLILFMVFLLLLAITHKRKALHHTLMTLCTLSLIINLVVYNWIMKILNRRRDAGNTRYKARDNGKRSAKQDEHKAMVTIDGAGSDTEVTSCLKVCEESFAKRKKLYDEQKEQLEAEKEKKELKTKLENFQSSSKGLSKLLNSQMNAKDKFGLRSSDVEDSPVNDRYVKVRGMHATDAPIIEEYKSDSDDEHVTIPLKEQEKPSFAFVNTVEHLTPPRQTSKEQNTCSQNPKPSKRDWNGLMPKNWVWDKGLLKRHALYVVVLAISLEIVISMRKERLNRPQQVVIRDKKDIIGTESPNTIVDQNLENDNPYQTLNGKGIVNSGCSKHMTGNKAYLVDYQDFNGGPVAFEGSKGQIIGKGKIKTGVLDFEDVYFVKELQHFNLFSVSQMCDKKNKVLFTDIECLVLSLNFKLPDENKVLLRVLRQHNTYSFNLENIVTFKAITAENKANKTASLKETNNSAGTARASSTNYVNTTSLPVNAASIPLNTASTTTNQDDSQIPSPDDIYEVSRDGIFTSASYADEGAVTDFTNLVTTMNVSPIPTSRIHSIHPTTQILGDPTIAV
nr:ribonuclease H-like domain-containing protein [Tanacetum cinerariifolium]